MGGELGVDRLDGDPAVQRGVGREEHDAHAAPSEFTLEPVLRFQHGLERGEQIEGRRRHGPTGVGTEPAIYPGAAFVGCITRRNGCSPRRTEMFRVESELTCQAYPLAPTCRRGPWSMSAKPVPPPLRRCSCRASGRAWT